jgi:hypothetical protein
MCFFQCNCVRKKERKKENSSRYFHLHMGKNPVNNDAIENTKISNCQQNIAHI